ncbi:MAG: exo-beta-N-acetylmuramidase NamZ domain-containing protein [Polyangiales bacterium]
MGRLTRLTFALVVVACGGGEVSSPREQRRATPPPSEEVMVPVVAETSPPRVRVSLPPPIRIDVNAERAIDAAVAGALAADSLPGAVVLIGDSQGTHFARAYGQRSVEPTRSRMSLDTVFDLASLTKVFTALGVLRLVAAGRLTLEEDLGRHIPALAGVSAEDLLLHRAGFPAVDALGDYVTDRDTNIERILATERTPPGAFRYSDLGYIALGEVIERMSGKPLDEAIRELVCEPLGLQARFRPEFDERIAPTEYAPRRAAEGEEPPMIRGVVHDPRAYRLGGVAGHAGLFASASDVAKVARMLLGGVDGFLPEALRRRMLTPVRMGEAERTLGLDAYDGGVAHRGFTGTFLHVHEGHGRFAVVLTHAVHPRAQGNAAPLRDAIRALANEVQVLAEPAELAFGIDVLRAESFRRLAGKRVGLFTHDAAVARDGQTTRRLLQDAVDLRLLFAPEHGLGANREGVIADERADGVVIQSLFGANRDPRPEAFERFDVLIVDIQDVGARFYTYFASMHRLLRAAALAGTPVLILDRPNPLGGVRVEGPLVEPSHETFINHHPLPILHGLSAGEMARLLVAEEELDVDLEVVTIQGWSGETWRDLNLRWVPASPNLRTLDAVELYPAVALVEGANVSVGRGTDTPFQLVGAPYVDAERLLAAVVAAGGRGEVASFEPSARPFRGRPCHGVRLSPDGSSLALGFAILGSLATHRQFQGARTAGLLASDTVQREALRGQAGLVESFRPAELAFEARRVPHLLYERRSQETP